MHQHCLTKGLPRDRGLRPERTFPMLGVRLDEKLDKKLTRIAKENKRPKSFYARQALEMYLDDINDFEEALKRHNDPSDKYLGMREMKKRLGL